MQRVLNLTRAWYCFVFVGVCIFACVGIGVEVLWACTWCGGKTFSPRFALCCHSWLGGVTGDIEFAGEAFEQEAGGVGS